MSARPHVLVVNAGSSSLKYQLIDAGSGRTVAVGLVSEIGGASRHRHEVHGHTHDTEMDCADHADQRREHAHGAARHVLEATVFGEQAGVARRGRAACVEHGQLAVEADHRALEPGRHRLSRNAQRRRSPGSGDGPCRRTT